MGVTLFLRSREDRGKSRWVGVGRGRRRWSKNIERRWVGRGTVLGGKEEETVGGLYHARTAALAKVRIFFLIQHATHSAACLRWAFPAGLGATPPEPHLQAPNLSARPPRHSHTFPYDPSAILAPSTPHSPRPNTHSQLHCRREWSEIGENNAPWR